MKDLENQAPILGADLNNCDGIVHVFVEIWAPFDVEAENLRLILSLGI